MKHQQLDYLQDNEDEWRRLRSLVQYEEEARRNGFKAIAGVDEAGRGPLAGPVVAAACIIQDGVYIPFVNDSKLLTPKKRQSIFAQIQSDSRIAYGIGVVDSLVIDTINIYQATIQAMLKAIEALMVQPDCLLVDGMHLPHPTLSCIKIIKGDTLSQSIAAASIIAKETRDRLMQEFHERWPHYGFNQHKGYGTAQHLKALMEHGPCEIHRRSFDPIKQYAQADVLF